VTVYTINWNAVKAAGYQFAILRIGYRGYRAGSLAMDPKFYQNLAGAQAAGLDIGVYFFAQAVNEQEAVEEADYVLGILQGYPLTMPIVYDPETIESPAARTNSVSGEQLTKNAAAFCDEIRKGGYTPMIYSNMLWQAYKLNMSELGDELFWYADYEPLPQTPYDFALWQHSQSAFVPGVPTACDVDIQMLPIPQLP
jgi:GH25 family lysozyme M1 (1,4-beta-N-acetylmuramidase)